MLTINNYRKAESLSEAYELNQKKSNRIIGGMMWMRMGNAKINTAIDLSGLGLDTVEETEDEFRIGCMVTLRQLEMNLGFQKYTNGCVKEALRHIVGVQFRNLATVGGSIYGRYGFSDVLTLLLVLDSYVELYQGGIVPLREYAAREYDRDVLVRIIVKKKPIRMFYEAVRITETDLPVLTCAAVRFEEDSAVAVSIGARPGRAILVEDKDGIFAEGMSAATIQSFSEYAKATVPTEGNMRGNAGYRSHLVGVLVKRALMELYPENDGKGLGKR